MTTNRYSQLLLASTLLSISGVVTAETFSYTFISASYITFREDIDGISEDIKGDAINLNLSLNLAQNVAITAGFGTGSSNVTYGGFTIDGDTDGVSFGATYHIPIDDKIDFMALVQLFRSEVDLKINGSSIPGNDYEGKAISAGVRAMAASNVELNGVISRSKIEDESKTDISFGASYYLNKLFTINARYSFDSDGDSLSFGATKYF